MSELAGHIADALAEPAWEQELAGVYRQADAAISATLAREAITCLAGGCCCRFDVQEHRLYASTLELAYLCRHRPGDIAPARRGLCPYQRFTQCTAHERRPLGCRTFFCRDGKGAVQGMYEPFHRRLLDLHEQAHVAYRYAELTQALLQFFTAP